MKMPQIFILQSKCGSGGPHTGISDSIFFSRKIVMIMAGEDCIHSIFFENLVKRIRLVISHILKPERLMEENIIVFFILIFLQVRD